jgi:hypothetical protein
LVVELKLVQPSVSRPLVRGWRRREPIFKLVHAGLLSLNCNLPWMTFVCHKREWSHEASDRTSSGSSRCRL